MRTAKAPLRRAPDGTITGNTYDKYGSRNPLVRRLVDRFVAEVEHLLKELNPPSLLDVGCGEGFLTNRFARLLGEATVLGIDLEERSLKESWARWRAPNLSFATASAEALPFSDHAFATVCALEVLEHLLDPEQALAELSRCASGHLLLSVPREPLWRALNVARGAYLPALGNTPGHLNHWSARGFKKLLARYGTVVELRTPLPWTLALVAL